MSVPMRRYTSKKYTYNPIRGVKSDFETLLQRFTETGTVRFSNFAEIWRDMDLSKYCAGRQTLREAREFVEECLKIATQFWLPPSSFQVRAGALYLLYGLYNYQITSPKTKIRVTPENWKSILEFQSLAREQQHLDIDYVFQKLKLDRAFTFVATTNEFYPYDYKDDAEGKTMPDNLKDDESLLAELYSSQVLNQLAAVHDQYHKMKMLLAGDDYTDEPDTSLNIINNNLIQNIYKTLQSHKEKMTPQPSASQSKHNTSLGSSSDNEQTEYKDVSVKSALKKKAFATYTESRRRRSGPGRPNCGRRGRPRRDQRIQDSVVNLQDPKINAVGRMKGRLPKMDIFGKDEEVVIGPGVSASLGLVDMPNLNHILGKDEEEENLEKTKKSAQGKGKKNKKETGRSRKKEISSDIDTDKEEVTLKKKSRKKMKKSQNDFDTESEEATLKKKIKKGKSDIESDAETLVPKKTKKTKKAVLKKSTEEETTGSDALEATPKKSGIEIDTTKTKKKKAQKKKSTKTNESENEAVLKVEITVDGKNEVILVKKDESGTSDEEWMEVEDSTEHLDESTTKKSPIQTNKKEKAKLSPLKSPKKWAVDLSKGKNKRKKVAKLDVSKHQGHDDSMKLPTKVAKTPVKRSAAVLDDGDRTDATDVTPAKTPRRTARMSVVNSDIEQLHKFKTSGKESVGEVDVKIEDHIGIEQDRSSRKKAPSKRAALAKKNSNAGTVDSGKRKKDKTHIISEAPSSSGEKAGSGGFLKNTGRKSVPSAQERLNIKIAKRMKEKRRTQDLDGE